ncbi:MAG: hypothetical protein ACLUYS_08585 [Allobaculum sp.]
MHTERKNGKRGEYMAEPKTKMEKDLERNEIELLKEEVASLKKVKTGWMIAAIISFALFAITLGILFT